MSDRDDIPAEELRQRVIYTLMLPAVRVARMFGVSLSDMKAWIETAYFHETRHDELTNAEVADLMDVSTSKVSLLSRQLRELFTDSTDADTEAALPRRIEFMLWAEPLTRARLKQVITGVDDADVDRAVDQLLEQGRVAEVREGRKELVQLEIDRDRRVWDSWLARIDGLKNAMANVADAAFGRFFEQDDRAFARTLTFRIRPEAIEKLREWYENEVFELVTELDEQAEAGAGQGDDGEEGDKCKVSEQPAGEEGALPLRLSIFWAPYRYIRERVEAPDD